MAPGPVQFIGVPCPEFLQAFFVGRDGTETRAGLPDRNVWALAWGSLGAFNGAPLIRSRKLGAGACRQKKIRRCLKKGRALPLPPGADLSLSSYLWGLLLRHRRAKCD